MRLLALRITASTYRGTLLGVPALIETLRRHNAGATFLFSLGPDHSGRAIKRLFRAGYLGQFSRTRGISHYGLATLLNGTLLPAPQIGRRAAAILQGVRDSGFETGVQGWDHLAWEERISTASPPWIAHQMQLAADRYADIFGAAPEMCGAAGWQSNRHALRLTQRLGYVYASDTRGTHPFMPVLDGEIFLCPQLPTTLPTTDELVGFDGVDESNVDEALLRHTAIEPAHGHVFTLRAEREGMKLMSTFEKLLTGWREQGYSIVALRDIADRIDRNTVAHHQVVRGSVAGRLGSVMMQGPEYLADWKNAA